ncbi:MAG: hypothetical protein R8P61_18260 [Bacteroidia bacterium]|nr:hypothetical protein [Bacteroidia bacterium]
MYRKLATILILCCCSLEIFAQNSESSAIRIGFNSGISMGRWIYDKGQSEDVGGFHQGYDRSHLAIYVPIGAQINYDWKKWSIGIMGNISWLADDELVSSTTRVIVPREYFITDGSNIKFENYGFLLERSIIDRARYRLRASAFLGSFRSEQDHPREEFFDLHYFIDLGLTNELYLSDSWFIMIRPVFKRKVITTKDSPFEGESHEIISFGIDYGFGFRIY